MKKLIILIVGLIVITSCKKENSTLTKFKDAAEGIKNTKQVFDNAQDAQKEMLKLKDLEPLSNDVLKEWMPESLNDLKRSSYKLGKNGYVNISTVKLEYKHPDDKSKKITVELIDGAGNGSAAIYMYKLIQNTDMESESETGYEKTYKRDGVFIKEKYQNENYGNRTKMDFLVNDRFAVTATGYGMNADELWKYLKRLKLDKLKE